jgi:hypothetical protein
MTVRFTSGGAGKFTFDVANKLLDTADELSGQPISGDQSSASRSRETMVARLVEKVPDLVITVAGVARSVWRWHAYEQRKGSSADPNLRYLAPIPNLDSQTFGAAPSGLAVQINGSASVGDVVVLSPLVPHGDISSERWFAFAGNADPLAGGIGGVPTIAVGRISGYQQVGVRKWLYEIQIGQYRTLSTGLPYWDSLDQPMSGKAINVYEDSDLYGQNTSFVMGSLEVFPIPHSSRVIIQYQTRFDDGTPVYVFMAPNPMRPECNGPGMAQMQQGRTDRILRDGI